MASLIDIQALTLNPEEASDIASLIIEREFENGVLTEDHAVSTGIVYKHQIPFAGSIADSLKKSSGCTPNPGSGVSLSEKFWDPEIFDSRWEHCAPDLDKLFKLFQKISRINPDYFDKQGSQELGMIYSLITQMLRETLPTKVWFSDKAAETIANAGLFANGTDVDLYNVIDGLWKQFFTEIPPGNKFHVNVTANEGNSYANQSLSNDAVFGLFETMLETADERLISDPAAKILCTRSMADNYRKTLRNKTLGAGFIEITENGKQQLFFDGYPISIRYDWDRNIKRQDNGTILNLPHRAILTVPDNIPVGTPSESDFDTFDSFYDKYRKANITDVAFGLDAKLLEDYRAVVAY